MPSLNQKILARVPIFLPSKIQQEKIADLLFQYDEKITINNQINQTLEKMAQTLFKSWFVDFDPVKAKMNGEQPKGMDTATASLFPEKLVESEFGLIPEGWEILPSENVATVAIGKTPPRKEPQWFSEDSKDVTWISIRDMGNTGTYALDSSEYLTQEAVDKFNVKVIPHNTLILSFKLTVGRVAITHGEMATNEAIAHYKLSKDARVSTNYLYSYMKQFNFDSLGSTSSIAKAVNSKIIKALPVVVPSKEVLDSFDTLVKPLFDKIKSNQMENRSLEDLRDTLLPKLLSGEVDLDAPDSFAEDKLISKLLEQLDFGIEFKLSQQSLPKGYIGLITVSGTFGSNGGTHVHVPTAVKALSKLTTAEGAYGEIAGNVATETLTSGAVELVTNNIIPLGVLTKVCTAVFGKKTPIKPKDAVLLTTIHEATNKSIDGILNEQAKRFAFLELPCMDEQELEQSLQYLESIGVVKSNGKTIVLLDSIVQH